MREENISGEVLVSRLFGKFLDSGKKIFVHVVAAKLLNKLIVVDFFPCGIGDHVRVNNDLFFLRLDLDVLLCFSYIGVDWLLGLCGFGSLLVLHGGKGLLLGGSEKSGVKKC